MGKNKKLYENSGSNRSKGAGRRNQNFGSGNKKSSKHPDRHLFPPMEEINGEWDEMIRTKMPEKYDEFKRKAMQRYGEPDFVKFLVDSLIANEKETANERAPQETLETFSKWVGEQPGKIARADILDQLELLPRHQWAIFIRAKVVACEPSDELKVTKTEVQQMVEQSTQEDRCTFLSDWELDRYKNLGGDVPADELKRIPPPDAKIPPRKWIMSSNMAKTMGKYMDEVDDYDEETYNDKIGDFHKEPNEDE